MNKYRALMFILASVTLVKAQEPEVKVEVKEEKEKEEVKLPVEKKKKHTQDGNHGKRGATPKEFGSWWREYIQGCRAHSLRACGNG